METTKQKPGHIRQDHESGDLIIAVAGNPNAGKSTLINAIAGSRLHVGNWPGVTVEKNRPLLSFRAGASRWWTCREPTV